MVHHPKSAKVRKNGKTKQVTLKSHHAKPYRKRHVGLLLICAAGAALLIALLVEYRDQVLTSTAGSRSFVADLFNVNAKTDVTYRSLYGFSLNVDEKKFFSAGINATDGSTVRAGDTEETLPLNSIILASAQSDFAVGSGLQLHYHQALAASTTAVQLQDQAFGKAGISKADITLIETKTETLGGKEFEKTVWRSKNGVVASSELFPSYSLYTAIVNDHPMTILVSEGFADKPGLHPLYDDVLQSLSFGRELSAAASAPIADLPDSVTQKAFDALLSSKISAAASKEPPHVSETEKIAALYGPSVVKVYNAYCADIQYKGKLIIKNACQSGSGSGFFVSQDGYVATNGHVASMNARDISIVGAFSVAIFKSNSALISGFMTEAGVKESDYENAKTKSEAYGLIADKLYEKLPESNFSFTNSVQNLFVATGSEKPDTEQILKDTKERRKHSLKPSFKAATMKASDFRSLDGVPSFKASDIAILKVDGNNYPLVKLGSYDDATQGAGISILGFPGNASNNGIVDSKSSTATLTTGKVSAKKNASGSDKRLIETDTTIGHGNSGGPAFVDSGQVVGIATYTSDGSGTGDGVFNYIRDIKDLTDLADKKLIGFNTKSETQSQWEEGMGYFYTGRYSKALVNFAKVKELYPSHNKVTEFIATAERRIANGEDIKDFPVVPVAIGAGVLSLGAGAAVIFMVRHRKKHAIYKAGVAQGTVAPAVQGFMPQPVAVAQPVIQPAVAPQQPQVFPQFQQEAQPATPVILQAPAAPLQQPIVTQIPVSSPQPPVAPAPVATQTPTQQQAGDQPNGPTF